MEINPTEFCKLIYNYFNYYITFLSRCALESVQNNLLIASPLVINYMLSET